MRVANAEVALLSYFGIRRARSKCTRGQRSPLPNKHDVIACSCVNMAESVDQNVCIDDFRLFKVDALKEYCRRRGLPITKKRKEELVALAFAATVQNLPEVLTAGEQNQQAKLDYQGILTVTSESSEGSTWTTTLPDPLKDLPDGWLGEEGGVALWPPCMYINISLYLIDKDETALLTRLKNDYKDGQYHIYNYYMYYNNLYITPPPY